MFYKKKLQIIDIDDTLVMTSAKWILEAVKHPGLARRIGKLNVALEAVTDMKLYLADVYCRLQYRLEDYLEVRDIARSLFYKAYTENGNFYDDLGLSSFGASLLTGGVGQKIIFLTHTLDGACNISKSKWIKKNFGALDYEYVEIPITQSKGEYIQEHYPDFDTFVDDSPTCLLDVINRFRKEPKYVAFPEYGYNLVINEFAQTLGEGDKITIRSFIQKW